MITDKDVEEAVNVIAAYLGGGTEAVEKELSIYRAELTDQARKEAAERLCGSCPGCDYYNGGDIGDNCALRNAILAPSVKEGKTDTEKLAIAVKALEYVVSKSLPSSAFESHYSRLQDACAKASDALKEIQ
jgi:hypothetical protein